MDILQQDRRESAEQRQELCDIISRLQGDLQSTEEQRDKVGLLHNSLSTFELLYLMGVVCAFSITLQLEAQCEQLQLKVRTLHLDWETEQRRSMSYFNQVMELEKERDQVGADLISRFSKLL